MEDFICDLILFQGLSSPTMSFPTRLRNAGSSPNRKDNVQWLSSSAADVLEVGYCRLVMISTDNITQTNEYRSGVGAHWPFLSDAGRVVQKDLDIAEYTDPVYNPMIPHVIVLEPSLVMYKIYNGYWFFGRPLWKISARTYVPLPRNAGRTGTSQRPNSERRGSGRWKRCVPLGARPVRLLFWAIWPQARPLLSSYTVLRWEMNLRASTILGLVGGGGLGQAIYNNVQLGFYPRLSTLILLVYALVLTSDWIGERLRLRVA
jgi:hypothetical protein